MVAAAPRKRRPELNLATTTRPRLGRKSAVGLPRRRVGPSTRRRVGQEIPQVGRLAAEVGGESVQRYRLRSDWGRRARLLTTSRRYIDLFGNIESASDVDRTRWLKVGQGAQRPNHRRRLRSRAMDTVSPWRWCLIAPVSM